MALKDWVQFSITGFRKRRSPQNKSLALEVYIAPSDNSRMGRFMTYSKNGHGLRSVLIFKNKSAYFKTLSGAKNSLKSYMRAN
jgi:hypothetical protein